MDYIAPDYTISGLNIEIFIRDPTQIKLTPILPYLFLKTLRVRLWAAIVDPHHRYSVLIIPNLILVLQRNAARDGFGIWNHFSPRLLMRFAQSS